MPVLPPELAVSDTPSAILAAVNGLQDRITPWSMLEAAAILGGLQTDPKFAANCVRLEAATRLVLATSRGTKRVRRSDIYRLLNVDLPLAGIGSLEDPPENFFVSTLATRRGPFRIHLGIWEKANSFTEDLLEAFERLPQNDFSSRILDEVYALLALSDFVAHWASPAHATLGVGERAQRMDLPDERAIMKAARHAACPWRNIEKLGIAAKHLEPFALPPDADISGQRTGMSELEAQPLIFGDEGLVVAAPQNITTAARLHLVRAAITGGIGPTLRFHLLNVQAERVEASGFFLPPLHLDAFSDQPIGHAMVEKSPGRFVLFVHATDGFDEPPGLDFGGAHPANDLAGIVADLSQAAQAHARESSDFREGLTIVLAGGWGRGWSLPLPAEVFAPDWPIIVLETGDAADLGAVDHADVPDLWRIEKQRQLLAAQGFDLFGANGWPNLFAWWRETRYNLVPERRDIAPPITVYFPTDGLLDVRIEAADRTDRRPLPLPDGSIEIVMRLDRERDAHAFRRRYCAPGPLAHGELLGAVLNRIPVWLRVTRDNAKLGDKDFIYGSWDAAMHWLAVGLQMLAEHSVDLGRRPVLIDFSIEQPAELTHVDVDHDAVAAAVETSCDATAGVGRVHLAPNWQHGLHRATNYAELRLGAALLSVVLEAAGSSTSLEELQTALLAWVGSEDIRWRHSFIADRPTLMLSAHGLTSRFKAVSASAFALVRCGASFLTRPREAGNVISGEAECREFLLLDHKVQLARLLDAVAVYDRSSLVALTLVRLQSALAEDQNWNRSARALRALHGPEREAERSFARRNEINAVIRGCSIISEVAASHAAAEKGLEPGEMDLDELIALALLVFQNAELLPPILGGFVKPELVISPAGDVMYDHSFGENAMLPSARRRHADEREHADAEYRRHFEARQEQDEQDYALRAAVEAEYGAPPERLADFFTALGDLAVESRAGVFGMTRSMLIEKINVLTYMAGFDCTALIDALTLPSRGGWSDIPDSARARDFDFTRFDRRYSIIKRPLLAISGGKDPRIVVAPAAVERAIVHNFAGAVAGGLHDVFWDSAEMRKYAGRAAGRVGLEFNDSVAEAVRALGLIAYSSVNVTDALNQRGTEELKRLGDVDVLAFDANGRRAWVIEAKEIRFCRNISEVAARLSEYRGRIDAKGRRDNLRKHLDRVEYIRANANSLARRYSLSSEPEIRGLVVVGSHQPMVFLPTHDSPDAKCIMLSELGQVEWLG